MQIFQKVVIFVLVVAILLFGFLIYKKQNTNVGQTAVKTNNDSAVKETVSEKFDINALLAENPGAGATESQLGVFSQKVFGYSVETSEIDVSSCNPKPAVSRISFGKSVVFKNSDSISHKLVNGNLVIDVPASSSIKLVPKFDGRGIYGYSCDTKMVGIFMIVP